MKKSGDKTRKDVLEDQPDHLRAATPSPTHYVAVGASAGGLEAIESFFSHMPPENGLGFIVIQHLSPDYKSLMVELLSKRTPMPVHRARCRSIERRMGCWFCPTTSI